MDGMNQQDPLQELLKSLPPETLAQLLQSGTIDQRDQMLQQQMAQAHALRQQRGAAQPYGAGAGMASGLSGVLGGVKEGIVQNRQEASLGTRQASLQALVDALRNGGGGGAGLP